MNDKMARLYAASQRELYSILRLLWEYAESDDHGWYVIRVDRETARLIKQALGIEEKR